MFDKVSESLKTICGRANISIQARLLLKKDNCMQVMHLRSWPHTSLDPNNART